MSVLIIMLTSSKLNYMKGGLIHITDNPVCYNLLLLTQLNHILYKFLMVTEVGRGKQSYSSIVYDIEVSDLLKVSQLVSSSARLEPNFLLEVSVCGP